MNVRNYALVTASYWAFTLTDGALRMLVLLYFHDLGYNATSLAFLFLLYEFFGVVTNLFGGWIGARRGLNLTLFSGLALQVGALVLLSLHSPGWAEIVSVAWVMAAQAMSGIAKDLTKMSAKSAVKFVAGEGSLFTLVAALTGSKNALKGVGFFLGAALLGWVGFDRSLWLMAGVLAVVLVAAFVLIDGDVGRANVPPTRQDLWSKSPTINNLSLARLFLFGARDIWFVVALPVFLDEVLGWSFEGIGAFTAAWIIGYGICQSVAPQLLGRVSTNPATLLIPLAAVTAAIALFVTIASQLAFVVVVGLAVFGVFFAMNSSLHSFLILAYSPNNDEVAVNVGFYYSANAAGRLVGTLLSGVLYLVGGFTAALWGATAFLIVAWVISRSLPVSPVALRSSIDV